MRILVTGAAGFIGSHLTACLTEHGHHVVGVDRAEGDLTEPGVFTRHLNSGPRYDRVVHLAAQVGRLFGERDLEHTVRSNALMTTLVARACGDAEVPVVYASTSEVYGDQGDTICRESTPLKLPHNGYGLTKRWGEEACQLYAPDRLVMLRLSMPYGSGVVPGQGRAALPNIIWQAHTRQRIPIHRGAERSWCWVGDTVEGIRLIIESGETGPFNVGRDDDRRPMRQVAELACWMTGAPEGLIEDVDPPAAQTVVKRLATDRLRTLGWEPKVPLGDGMRRVYDWVARFDEHGQRAA